MTQLMEPVLVGMLHAAPDPECPFCPGKKNTKHYTTFAGADNSSSKLAKLIETPSKLGTSVEADARPKDGKMGKDDQPNQALADDPQKKLLAVSNGDRYWSFQAHHAISGNQCLGGHAVEKYIKAGAKVVYDTGYSVNNPENGVWLPSAPKGKRYDPSDPGKALWGSKTEKQKFASAKNAMDKFNAQFHLADHDIPADVDGLDPAVHSNYVQYVKGLLTDLAATLGKWEIACPNKEANGKHRGNPRIHSALDCWSRVVIGKLKGSPLIWTIFISAHARDYTRKMRKPSVKLDFE